MSSWICSIPMVPGADHRDMPNKLQMNCLTNATAKRNSFYPRRFGRLDYEGIFQTCMTDITLWEEWKGMAPTSEGINYPFAYLYRPQRFNVSSDQADTSKFYLLHKTCLTTCQQWTKAFAL